MFSLAIMIAPPAGFTQSRQQISSSCSDEPERNTSVTGNKKRELSAVEGGTPGAQISV